MSDTCGLRPRPVPDLAIVALVVSATDQVWPRPVVAHPGEGDDLAKRAWRFSGRWWSRPLPVRRVRSWPAGPAHGRPAHGRSAPW